MLRAGCHNHAFEADVFQDCPRKTHPAVCSSQFCAYSNTVLVNRGSVHVLFNARNTRRKEHTFRVQQRTGVTIENLGRYLNRWICEAGPLVRIDCRLGFFKGPEAAPNRGCPVSKHVISEAETCTDLDCLMRCKAIRVIFIRVNDHARKGIPRSRYEGSDKRGGRKRAGYGILCNTVAAWVKSRPIERR